MVTASIKDDLRSFRRSWVHHTGMQLATLTVLAATLTVVGFVFAIGLNLNRVLTSWGESVQMSVYLTEDTGDEQVKRIKKQLEKIPVVARVTYTPREAATENFKTQMASYAPDLLEDADFSNPFPASFRVALKGGVQNDGDVKRMEDLASTIGQIQGVEDVSYGQSWVKNYSSFVSAISAAGGIVVAILLAGSLFVIGNSIQASIASRREEIEILELVGATSRMIRRPYVFEGMMMGVVASVFALSLNYGVYLWQVSVMSSSFAFARMISQISFFGGLQVLGFVLIGAALGALGAWLTVRKINDGWSARQRLENG